MATVTKRDLVLELTKAHTISQQLATDVINTFIAYMNEALVRGDEVTLRKFGSFTIHVTKEKKGRNPNKPSVEITIPARATLKFRPSEELKDAIAELDITSLLKS
jgi:nucleoid DNA-binding protein